MVEEGGGRAVMIDLRHPLTLRNSFKFPLQSRQSRADIVVGGLWLLVPVFGWLLNMGHRVRVVHRMHRGEQPWPAWGNPRELLKHGVFTFAGMVWYGWPGVGMLGAGWFFQRTWVMVVGAILLGLAIVAIPGYMSHYCREYDPREIFDPFRALRRVFQGGIAYWKAWSIVVPAMLLSFLGWPVLGIGFCFTSVWFWQVAAFSFATVFTQEFNLDTAPQTSRSAEEKGS
jgi:hypothetical protein